MNWEHYILTFLFGVVLGSFANNVLSYYLNGSNFDLGRSLCYCRERKLKYYELIPVISYLTLRGKCKECKSPLPKRYILLELFSGIISLGIFHFNQYSFLESIIMTLLAIVIILVGIIDYKLYIIPNKLLIVVSLLIIARYLLNSGDFLFVNLTCAFLICFGLIITAFMFKRVKGKDIVGMGDIKFIFLLMLLFNFPLSLISIWIASLLGLAFIFLTGKRKSEELNGKIPFGFCLSLSVLLLISAPLNNLGDELWRILQ